MIRPVELESILAIIGIFFLPIIMVVFIVWFRSKDRRKRYQLQAELYAKAIETGQTLPTDLFAEMKSESKKKRNPLNTGVICIAVGIGVFLFFWLARGMYLFPDVEMYQVASLGIIPFFIGVAYVIIHFVDKKKNVDEKAQ